MKFPSKARNYYLVRVTLLEILIFCILIVAIFAKKPPIGIATILIYLIYKDNRSEKQYAKKVMKSFDDEFARSNLITLGKYCRITKGKHKEWNDQDVIKYAINYCKKEKPEYWIPLVKEVPSTNSKNITDKCVEVFRLRPHWPDETVVEYVLTGKKK